jgi:hypothetical protein
MSFFNSYYVVARKNFWRNKIGYFAPDNVYVTITPKNRNLLDNIQK